MTDVGPGSTAFGLSEEELAVPPLGGRALGPGAWPAQLERLALDAALTLQVVAINDWNRLAVGLRTPVGDHVSPFRADVGASP